ncbi:MAG TPA: hypothetical protein ENI85_19395 [Deltaproteobacteria bacterium]|nr:hypothetical protein [Deltaproteobacteria bacterium]
MNPTVDLVLSCRPLERIASEVAVVGFFADERPLREGAARADWRLCGGLSRRIEAGDLSGKSGEALLVGCGRALASPRLMLLGLGGRRGFDRARVRDEVRMAVDRCLALGCTRIALAPLGIASDDLPRHAAELIGGFHEAARTADRPISLSMPVPTSEIPGVTRAFDQARKALGAAGFQLRADEVERGDGGSGGSVAGSDPGPGRIVFP